MAEAPDQAARDRITDDLESTLFVEAGAGSGKTTELVNRVVSLVTIGKVELANIAAVTFTDKAAVELRDRIRQQLEGRAERDSRTEIGDRCRAALEQLDSAAIGTLHAFAQRLLSEHPIEVGLPPRVEVLDEVSSGVEFERRWTVFRDQLLADPAYERTLLLLFASGVPEKALRALAVAFNQNWDLVEERIPADAPEPPAVVVVLERFLPLVYDVCAEGARCRDQTDKLCQRLGEIAEWVAELRGMEDESDLLEALRSGGPSFAVGGLGKGGVWGPGIRDFQARVRAAGEALKGVRVQVAHDCAHKLGAALRGFTIGAAAERRDAGQLEFHDLLVLSRALVRDNDHGPSVRRQLAKRYQRLLLDEFQDTDPIQIELAVRIAALDPGSPEAGDAEWLDVPVAPGHLFVVGDPKQSIYRFRRADISLFGLARGRFGPEAGGVVELTANFRSGAPLISWVNHTFAALMDEQPEIDLPVASRPEFVPLEAVRTGRPSGPPVAVIGRTAHPTMRADDLRAAEAADVAATVAQIMAEEWTVDDGASGWRPARLGDITILVPTRTSLPFLEDALEGSGIPFRAESSSLVYATRAVRDLLMVLRAADDPTDQLRTVAALRTPLLACGDDDLFRFRKERGGSWSYLATQPSTVPEDDPVRTGLAYLRDLYLRRQWEAPSELLDRIARDRRALELGFAEGRPRDVWRRLRFVIDQARAWSDATGGSLRQYLDWVKVQTAEGARVAESVLPETDDDAVRIMTIHAAKGLQFPVTILSGMSTKPGGARGSAEVVFPYEGKVGYRFSGDVKTLEFIAQQPIDEQMDFDERGRLLYVACTRARDHLVVSLHRLQRARPPDRATSRTNAELLMHSMGELLAELEDAGTSGPEYGAIDITPAEPPPAFEEWKAERQAALARSSRPTAVAATAITDEGGFDGADEPDTGLQKRPRDLDLPPWLKGRYGSAVGRAVHGTLQTIDLATGAGLDAAAAAQCEAEAIPDRADDVRRLVRHALVAPSVVEAASRPHWREVYACTPVEGDRLLEGYVDLLYRSDDGLVVVDYKTSSSAAAAVLDQRVEGYRFQGAAYALAAGAATGEPVVRVTFLFLTRDGVVERHLADLDAAIAEVRTLVMAGSEVLVE